jgi:hypothetical protein
MGQGDYDSQRGSVGVISVELNEDTEVSPDVTQSVCLPSVL